VLSHQTGLLNNSSGELKGSPYVLPAIDGGFCRFNILKKRFSYLRDHFGIQKEFRLDYCPGNTIASMMLSNGATFAEVFH
jgi:hypothetical protein